MARSYHFTGDHVVYTGPITGTVTTEAGRVVDVSDHYADADSAEEAAEIAHLIATRYVDEGHPTDPNFTYEAPKGQK